MKIIAFVLLAAILPLGLVQAAPPSATPGLALQGGAHYAFRVGDVEITALSDGTVPQDLHVLLRGATATKIDDLLHDGFLVNPVEASINAFLFRSAGHLVLVDTGAGEFFGPGYGDKLVASLAAVGIAPTQITDVLLTHAHDDHMGGLVHGGKLTFPNATVHLDQIDLDFFLDRTNSSKAHYDMSYFDQAATALTPVLAGGKLKAFQGTTEVLAGVTATEHPGHTPGSVFYTLVSHGQSIVFTGDIIHVAMVQAPVPDITITYDVDPSRASAIRKTAFAEFAANRTLIAVPHMPFPGVGHIRKIGVGFEWVPISYGNRLPTATDSFADPHKNGDKH